MRLVALVRGVPASYADATRRDGATIDVTAARFQHAAYVAALEAAGAVVHRLAPEEEQPDSLFVEDTAVIVGGRAVITRSAHPGRAAERASVATALAGHGLEILMMQSGFCDGGDVMVVGGRLFAGRSARTDDAGIASLGALGLPITPVDLPPQVLHLKCVCSPLGDDVLLAEGTLDPDIFSGLRVHLVPNVEQWASNVVAVGRKAVMGRGFARAASVVANAGYEPILLDSDQIRAGDGAMTCLSLRW